MGNEYFFSLSPSSNFCASLLLATLGARDFSCAVSGFRSSLKKWPASPLVSSAEGRRRVGLRPTKLLVTRDKKISGTQGTSWPMVQWRLTRSHFFTYILRAKANAFLSDARQPITQNETTYIRDLFSRKRENSSLFLTPVGQTKGKMAENQLPAPTSGAFSTHVNPSGARWGLFPIPYANKFALLSVFTLMKICLKIWEKSLGKKAKRYTCSCRRVDLKNAFPCLQTTSKRTNLWRVGAVGECVT